MTKRYLITFEDRETKRTSIFEMDGADFEYKVDPDYDYHGSVAIRRSASNRESLWVGAWSGDAKMMPARPGAKDAL